MTVHTNVNNITFHKEEIETNQKPKVETKIIVLDRIYRINE